MRKTIFNIAGSLSLALSFILTPVHAEDMNRKEIIAEAEKMALTQFDAMGWNFWGRFWMDGVCFAGVADLSTVSDNPKILEAIKKLGTRTSIVDKKSYGPWCLLQNEAKDPHHADDMVMAQAFLEYYAKTKDETVLADTKHRVDAVTAYILSEEAADKAAHFDALGTHEGLTWSWIDALFMAAPVHARLTTITGEPTYLNAMLLEWKRVSDRLYDKEEHLYYRDKAFLTRKSKSGKKVFWARGNGWVMGAFARTLPYIPKDNPQRSWLVEQFKEMSAKMVSIQRPDGTWSPSLLDYEQFPYSETSGTALNCFAMAWGINNRILDEKTYRPVVEKAWAALLAAKNSKGFLGYVQGIGAEPAKVNAESMTWYGNGAFMMAAVQMAELAPLHLPPSPKLTAVPSK